MIFSLFQVVVPIFRIFSGGYLTLKCSILSSAEINGVLKFIQTIPIPIFLFLSMLSLDLSSIFDWRLLLSFYTGAILCFLLAIIGARALFQLRGYSYRFLCVII